MWLIIIKTATVNVHFQMHIFAMTAGMPLLACVCLLTLIQSPQ